MQVTNLPQTVVNELQQPYSLNQEQIDFYQRNKYIKLKQVLSETTLNLFNEAITYRVAKLNTETRQIKDRDTYGKAFIQTFNLWQQDPFVKELVFSPRLAQLATDLMQTKGVRIYHDQALFKESGGGITPWHADQYYWPLQSDKTITAWIPLQATPLEMGPLEFSAGSHQIITGRDLEISDNSEIEIQKQLRITNFRHVIEPFNAGEISFHSGWVFHRAGANNSAATRKVMTVIYMDKAMILKEPENVNQQNDLEQWCPGATPGEEVNSPLNPILFQY
jgi:ectoine hydroxylase-related dioxygenase (phytanoyl-CoA dioxygenase family)